jgi:hypothetical protein
VVAGVPNQALQQTGHANNGPSGFNVFWLSASLAD